MRIYWSANPQSWWPLTADSEEINKRRVRMSRLYIGVLALVVMCCQIAPSAAMRMPVVNSGQNSRTSLEMSSQGGLVGNQKENKNNNRKSRSTLGSKTSGSTSSKISTNGISDHGAASRSSDDISPSDEFEPLYSQVRSYLSLQLQVFLYWFLFCVLFIYFILSPTLLEDNIVSITSNILLLLY